jgi:membrane protease YdiL (CAAX protease family)
VAFSAQLTPAPPPETCRSIRIELIIVFAITLGASAVRSVISILDSLLKPVPLASQTVTVVAPRAQQSWTDLAYQLVAIGVGVAWGSLGVYLLWRAGYRLVSDLGLDWRWSDLGWAGLLAAAIGIPGIAFYVVAFRMGLNVTVQPAALNDHWWSLPVLVLAAAQNGFLEEVLVVGYLLTRLRQLSVSPWIALAASALLRGCYHLYQGGGQALGNVIMGLIFGYVFLRWQRLWPIVVAHLLMDVVAFVGYTYLGDWVQSWLS